MLSDTPNQSRPHRVITTVDSPRARPTAVPQARTTGRWARASAKAGRIIGVPGLEIANAKTAFRKKLAAVTTVTASTSGITTGPVSTWSDFPCRTWAFKSIMAAQIHIAGSIWISDSRQFVTSSLTPANSMSSAPTARASGANTGPGPAELQDRLRRPPDRCRQRPG